MESLLCKLVLLVSFLFFSVSTAQQCVSICNSGNPGFNSVITPNFVNTHNASISWTGFSGETSYIVQHKLASSNSSFFVSSPQINDTSYIIVNLEPGSLYSVQVCRFSMQNDCGNCLICITTERLNEPPSPPRITNLESLGPQTIYVTYTRPDGNILRYHIVYTAQPDGVSMNLTITVNADTKLEATLTDNIKANTTYNVTVLAENEHGISQPSSVMQITTPTFSVDPAVLLEGFGNEIRYHRVNEQNHNSQPLLNGAGISASLVPITPGTVARDIDYHYYKNEIYVTFNDNTIIRYVVNNTLDGAANLLNLQLISSTAIYSSLPSGLGDITVDWINDVLYWVVNSGSSSQIYSGSLSGGPISTVGSPINGNVSSLTVDPIHGFFYWVVQGDHLLKVNLSVLENSYNSTTNLMGDIIFNSSDVSNFILDLADNRYFVAHGRRVTLKGLSGNTIGSRQMAFVPNKLASYSTTAYMAAVSGSQTALIFINVATNDAQQGFIFSTDFHDVRMFRRSYQPLPVPPAPPSNIIVLSNYTSVSINWSNPILFSPLFGVDAYGEWEYRLDYRIHGSSDELNSTTTTSTQLILTDLEPNSLYEFTLTAIGSGGFKQTDETLVFHTLPEGQTPELLIAGDQGVIRTDHFGTSPTYISRTETDDPRDVIYNSLLDIYYVVRSSGAFVSQVDNSQMPDNPFGELKTDAFALQLDWIARNLYWVESNNRRIVSVPTVNFTRGNQDSYIATFYEEITDIKDMAIDSSSGVIFWIAGSAIKGRTLNGLKIFTCITLSSSPAALTIDPVNNNLYYISFQSSTTTIGVLNYTTFECDLSHLTRSISQLPLVESSSTSIAYGASTLFITQETQTVVYSIPANIQYISSSSRITYGRIDGNPPLTQDSPSSNSFRSISIILKDLQPLPGNLTSEMTGNVSVLTPPPPGLPVLNRATSNETYIDVIWTPSDFTLSPVVYVLALNLTQLNKESQQVDTTVMSGNSYQISGQSFSTRVEATITAYSYWYSASSINNTFFSPEALPGKVRNVRVYTYFPLKDSREGISGLVVWDGLSALDAGGSVSNYHINITNAATGQLLTASSIGINGAYTGPPFVVNGTVTVFSLTIQGHADALFFILDANQSYNVEVFASNSAGNGPPSDTVNFNTSEIVAPLEIVTSSPNGGYVESEFRNISLSQVTPPIAVDVLRQTVYYYNSNKKGVYMKSLDTNAQDKLLVVLRDGFVPLGFAYDWIAQTLYIIGRTNNGSVNIRSYFRLFPQSTLVYESTEVVTNDVTMSLVVNPFSGLLHWTQSGDTTSSLNQFNLVTKVSTNLITSMSSRKRDTQLEPSGGLVWDTVTNRLWFCDRASNSIVSCNVTMGQLQCVSEVNGSSLSGTTGLPCDSLTLDQNRIYWTTSSSLSVYYVTRNEPTVLLTLPLSSNNSVLFSTSPGLQPYPNANIDISRSIGINTQTCLSPNFSNINQRPVTTIVNVTNTTIFISWTVDSSLPAECTNRVVSILPLTYSVNLEHMTMQSVTGYPMGPIYVRQAQLTDLEPYTEYMVEVEARNEFTVVLPNQNIFGPEVTSRTLEGVPDPVTGLNTVVFGPHHVFFSWNELNTLELKGSTDNQTFDIFIDSNRYSTTRDTNVTIIDSSLLQANSQHDYGVSASNGVLSSEILSSITNTTWILPPYAREMNKSNTSIVAMVTLEESHSVLIWFTLYAKNSTHEIRSSENYTLSDLNSTRPLRLTFEFLQLHAYTNYTLITEGQYQSVNVNGSELSAGRINRTSEVILTSVGVPDRPSITLSGTTLSWNQFEHSGNGLTITNYILMYRSPTSNVTMKELGTTSTTYDINRLQLTESGDHILTLVARNRIGDSPESNNVTYFNMLTEATPWYLDPAIIIPASVGVFVIILIVLALLLCFCCCCMTRSKGTMTFGPDYELSRLRALHSNTRSAANPNYLWRSFVDYNCTDEDLELLTKFPRNKLRLENFIDRGEFGEVYQGTALDILGQGTGPTPVAVKTMRKGSSSEEQRKFLSEAALASNFNHLNIVKVLGVCLDNDPIYIIMELMPGGDLLKFLRDARRDHGPALLTLQELVQIALDVAQGCRYLEQQHFIHRDIAARNCLVSSRGADRVVKIGDFGLAKDLYSSDYYQVEGQRKLPVRWMAPEALLQGKFTIESDIWSYGILLWEIMTLGNQPYPGRTNQEVLQFVTGGGRLERPENCPGRLYKIMQCCWKKYSSERPHFSQLVEIISNFLEQMNNKRDSYCSDDDEEDIEEALQRRPSKPSRTSSVRSGFFNLARQGSMRIRNSFRRRSSLHRKEEIESPNQNHAGMNSEEDLIGDDRFRERGPF